MLILRRLSPERVDEIPKLLVFNLIHRVMSYYYNSLIHTI